MYVFCVGATQQQAMQHHSTDLNFKIQVKNRLNHTWQKIEIQFIDIKRYENPLNCFVGVFGALQLPPTV